MSNCVPDQSSQRLSRRSATSGCQTMRPSTPTSAAGSARCPSMWAATRPGTGTMSSPRKSTSGVTAASAPRLRAAPGPPRSATMTWVPGACTGGWSAPSRTTMTWNPEIDCSLNPASVRARMSGRPRVGMTIVSPSAPGSIKGPSASVVSHDPRGCSHRTGRSVRTGRGGRTGARRGHRARTRCTPRIPGLTSTPSNPLFRSAPRRLRIVCSLTCMACSHSLPRISGPRADAAWTGQALQAIRHVVERAGREGVDEDASAGPQEPVSLAQAVDELAWSKVLDDVEHGDQIGHLVRQWDRSRIRSEDLRSLGRHLVSLERVLGEGHGSLRVLDSDRPRGPAMQRGDEQLASTSADVHDHLALGETRLLQRAGVDARHARAVRPTPLLASAARVQVVVLVVAFGRHDRRG